MDINKRKRNFEESYHENYNERNPFESSLSSSKRAKVQREDIFQLKLMENKSEKPTKNRQKCINGEEKEDQAIDETILKPFTNNFKSFLKGKDDFKKSARVFSFKGSKTAKLRRRKTFRSNQSKFSLHKRQKIIFADMTSDRHKNDKFKDIFDACEPVIPESTAVTLTTISLPVPVPVVSSHAAITKPSQTSTTKPETSLLSLLTSGNNTKDIKKEDALKSNKNTLASLITTNPISNNAKNGGFSFPNKSIAAATTIPTISSTIKSSSTNSLVPAGQLLTTNMFDTKKDYATQYVASSSNFSPSVTTAGGFNFGSNSNISGKEIKSLPSSAASIMPKSTEFKGFGTTNTEKGAPLNLFSFGSDKSQAPAKPITNPVSLTSDHSLELNKETPSKTAVFAFGSTNQLSTNGAKQAPSSFTFGKQLDTPTTFKPGIQNQFTVNDNKPFMFGSSNNAKPQENSNLQSKFQPTGLPNASFLTPIKQTKPNNVNQSTPFQFGASLPQPIFNTNNLESPLTQPQSFTPQLQQSNPAGMFNMGTGGFAQQTPTPTRTKLRARRRKK